MNILFPPPPPSVSWTSLSRVSLIFVATHLNSFGERCFLHSAFHTYLNKCPEIFIKFRERTLLCSTLTSLIYFLAILRQLILATRNPEMAHSHLSRKCGNRKQQNILMPNTRNIRLLSVCSQCCWRDVTCHSQIQSLSHHRLDPHPRKNFSIGTRLKPNTSNKWFNFCMSPFNHL